MGRHLPVIRWLFEDERPEVLVRSRRHKVSVPRVTREGNRPELLGPMTREERRDLELDEWELLADGAIFGPPADDRDCPPPGIPCLSVSCRFHLAADPEGDMVRLTFPGRDLDEIPETCALRVAKKYAERKDDPDDIGEVAMTCKEIGHFMNLSEEGTRLVEQRALAKFKAGMLAVLEGRPLDKTGARASRGGR